MVYHYAQKTNTWKWENNSRYIEGGKREKEGQKEIGTGERERRERERGERT